MALCGVTHFGTTSVIYGTVALPLQEPFATRILMLCFVPVLTSDLLPIPLKSFSFNKPCASWYRTRHCLQELRIDPTRFAEIIDLLDAWSTKRHCTKRQLLSLLASLSLFSLCAIPENLPTSYAGCPLQSSPSDPITFDGITPSTRTPFGGEISFHPGRVVASSMTTNGPSITFWSLHRRMPVWLRCLFRRRPALRVIPRPRRP